jgi:hypothetical protein
VQVSVGLDDAGPDALLHGALEALQGGEHGGGRDAGGVRVGEGNKRGGVLIRIGEGLVDAFACSVSGLQGGKGNKDGPA